MTNDHPMAAPIRLQRALERLQELVREASARRRLVTGDRFVGSRRSVADGSEPLTRAGLEPGTITGRPGVSLRRVGDRSSWETTLRTCIVRRGPRR